MKKVVRSNVIVSKSFTISTGDDYWDNAPITKSDYDSYLKKINQLEEDVLLEDMVETDKEIDVPYSQYTKVECGNDLEFTLFSLNIGTYTFIKNEVKKRVEITYEDIGMTLKEKQK